MTLLAQVERKLGNGERLTEDDAIGLYESAELVELGRLADQVNRAKNKDTVFFNVNRHINPTNICALSCKFCAYSRKPGEEGAYAYTIDEMVVKAGEAKDQGATEVHMVGGLHPRWKFDHYKEMIKAVATAYPSLHIKAFTAVELDWLARKARKSVEEVLVELRSVGLQSLPGGGAEIFHPEIRDAICDTKVSAEQWLDTHRTAHRLGMHSNCTMLYGHIENYFHRVDHMRRLRELQDETKGFNAFIPLSFQPFQNEMGIDKYTFGYDDLKTIAIARLYLDNFQHVKAYWIMLGQDVAQLALTYGANDLDGTVIEEKISRMAGGRAGMAMGRGYIENLIRKARRVPCERDTLYKPLTVVDPADQRVYPAKAAAALPLLARAGYEHDLTREELVQLAEAADLHDLGRLAHGRAEAAGTSLEAGIAPTVVVPLSMMASVGSAVELVEARIAACQKKYLLSPVSVAIELSGADTPDGQTPDLGLLLELVWAMRHTFADLEIVLRGMKALWKLAQTAGVETGDVLEQLKDAGADTIEASPFETERDITHGEIVALHRQVHALGVPTVAKVELDAPAQGAAQPLWDSYIRRVQAFDQLAKETGLVLGLSIEAAKGSFVTSAEYLRGIAMARIAAPNVPLIITPLASIPTISPAQGLGTASYQHPAEKIASLGLHYGASDLGAIDVHELSPVQVMKQIRSAGFAPILRDARLVGHAPGTELAHELVGIRHVPRTKAPVLS